MKRPKIVLPWLADIQRLLGVTAGGAVSASIVLTLLKNALQVGVGIALARILSPRGYGEFAFAMSATSILGVFAAFGFPLLLTREIATADATGDWTRARRLMISSNTTVFFALLLMVPAGVGAAFAWPNLDLGFRVTIAVAFGYLLFNTFGQLRGAILMGLRRVIVGQVGQMCIQPALLLLIVGVWVVVGVRALTPAGALGAATASAALVYLLNSVLARKLRPAGMAAHSSSPRVPGERWLVRALPFALLSGLYLFNSQIDVVMLGFLSRHSSVGLYRVAANGAALIPLVLAGVNPVLGPAFARHFALGEYRRLRRLMKIGALLSLAGAMPGVLAYILFGKAILGWVFGAAYLGAWIPLVVLTCGQFVNAAMGPVGLILNMTGHERETMWAMFAAAGLNVALNAVLVPHYGPLGAALATATSLVSWNVVLGARVWRRLRRLASDRA